MVEVISVVVPAADYWEIIIYILILVDIGPVFGQSWARDRYEPPRLDKWCINQRRIFRETDSMAVNISSVTLYPEHTITGKPRQ